jgi:hypothetical protein
MPKYRVVLFGEGEFQLVAEKSDMIYWAVEKCDTLWRAAKLRSF